MKKLKISDKDYELLMLLVQDAFLNAKSNSIREKDLKALSEALKDLR